MQDTRSTTEQPIDSTPGPRQQHCAGQAQGFAHPFQLSYVKDVSAKPERRSGTVGEAFKKIAIIAPQPYSKDDPEDVRKGYKFGRGFVPGLFEDGKPRRTPHMLAITAITLDIDNGPTVDEAKELTQAAGYACVGYWFPPLPEFRQAVLEHLGEHSGFAEAVKRYEREN